MPINCNGYEVWDIVTNSQGKIVRLFHQNGYIDVPEGMQKDLTEFTNSDNYPTELIDFVTSLGPFTTPTAAPTPVSYSSPSPASSPVGSYP